MWAMNDKLQTAPEVAERLGLNVEYTRRLIREGTIPSVKLGARGNKKARVFVALPALQEYIARRQLALA